MWLGIKVIGTSLAHFASRKWKCATIRGRLLLLHSVVLSMKFGARNIAVWNFKVPMVNRVSRQVKLAVKNRVMHIPIKGVNTQHPWIRNLFYFE